MAMSWFKKLGIDKRAHYAILRNSEPLRPLLVNAKHKGYYIVPLGYEEGRLSQGAVLLNAYNGDFLEVGVFQKPIKYLSEDRAVKIAINYLCACKYTREKIQVRLIFQPSEQTQSRFLPLWEITVEEVTVYITQEGTVFEQLTPLPLGD